MLPTKFRFIWLSSFRGEDFLEIDHQKQELPVAAMFINGSGQNVQFFFFFALDSTGDTSFIKIYHFFPYIN
jgi:hypothetical protein